MNPHLFPQPHSFPFLSFLFSLPSAQGTLRPQLDVFFCLNFFFFFVSHLICVLMSSVLRRKKTSSSSRVGAYFLLFLR